MIAPTRRLAGVLTLAFLLAAAPSGVAFAQPVEAGAPEAAAAVERVALFLNSVWLHNVEDAVAALQAEIGAFVQAATPPPPPAPRRSASSVAPVTTGGGVCGGATNGADQFIARESGGNPYVYNTGGSGAWGCYQIMPGTWNGSCSDIGSYGSATPAQQAACASRLPLSAWR